MESQDPGRKKEKKKKMDWKRTGLKEIKKWKVYQRFPGSESGQCTALKISQQALCMDWHLSLIHKLIIERLCRWTPTIQTWRGGCRSANPAMTFSGELEWDSRKKTIWVRWNHMVSTVHRQYLKLPPGRVSSDHSLCQHSSQPRYKQSYKPPLLFI